MMFRATRLTLVAVAVVVTAAGLVAVNTRTSRVTLPRSEAMTRVASAQMLVFVPASARSQTGGYIDGRPVPSGISTPLVVRYQERDASKTASATVLVPAPKTLIP